jgi:hypothetical protein
MTVVNKDIDALLELESKLTEAFTCEEAYPIYMAKLRFEEKLRTMEAEVNRAARGWAYMSPQPMPLKRSPVTSLRLYATQ